MLTGTFKRHTTTKTSLSKFFCQSTDHSAFHAKWTLDKYHSQFVAGWLFNQIYIYLQTVSIYRWEMRQMSLILIIPSFEKGFEKWSWSQCYRRWTPCSVILQRILNWHFTGRTIIVLMIIQVLKRNSFLCSEIRWFVLLLRNWKQTHSNVDTWI